MKKLFLLAVAVWCSTFSFSQSKDAATVTDFRDIYWGAKLDSIYRDGQKLEFIKDRSTTLKNAYVLKGDPMNIGNVRLNKLVYIFNDDNRFYKVFMEGPKEDFEQMKFILKYKFGEHVNERTLDNVTLYQWLVRDVTFTLKQYEFLRFELIIESSWQDAEAYKKNTNVKDF
ncbi:MAG: hypothetical protein RMJ53_04790 [Chitinophagales bacterium]|nr:hypothetical protein [Chitinophagales bacterium]MDW8273529.1 hypothetical protein [Chitinophagales bacterium]